MFDRENEFAYSTRRARQEEVAAINALSDAAAAAHRGLSRLYAARALLALLDPDHAGMRSADASRSRAPALC